MQDTAPRKSISAIPILVTLCASNLVTLVFVLYLIRIVSDGNAVMLSVIADGISREVDARAPAMVDGQLDCVGDCDQVVGATATFSEWDLRFNYPAAWHARLADNTFSTGKKAVLVTSAPGTLFRQGGAVVARDPEEFAVGAQLTISEITDRQVVVGKRQLTLLPTFASGVAVSKVTSECEDAGCPTGQYLIVVDNDREYFAEVHVVGDNSVADIAVTEAIITSLRR